MPKDMPGVMNEFKHKQLHSGSKTGPVVTSRKQAIAIGLSEQRQQTTRTSSSVPSKTTSTRRSGSSGHPHANLGTYLHPPKWRGKR